MADRCWVFDLDGVLIDSQDAVRAAYAEVGVVMPDWAWGQPWEAWLPQVLGHADLPASAVHSLKNDAYAAMLEKYGRPKDLSVWARTLVDRGTPSFVLTGASMRATRETLRFLKLDLKCLATGATTDVKSAALQTLAVEFPIGWYVDDQTGVTMPDGWKMLGVS